MIEKCFAVETLASGTLGARKRCPKLELAASGNVKIQSLVGVEKNGVL